MNSINTAAKPRTSLGRPPLQSGRLLDQVRERIRYLHYSLSTEQTYVYWVRWFIRFHGLRHPRELGKPEVEAFLTMLAHERKVSASTHRQALSALLFLYKEVPGQHLPWLDDIGRPISQRRIPSVLSPLGALARGLDPRHESGLAFPHTDAKLQSADPLHAQVLRKIKPTLTPGA